jgi:hypothetical protein
LEAAHERRHEREQAWAEEMERERAWVEAEDDDGVSADHEAAMMHLLSATSSEIPPTLNPKL